MVTPGFLRVDERLVHGQVLVAWAAALRPESIVLASDAVAADAFRRALYESLPHDDCEIRVETLAEAARTLARGGRVLVVVASPEDALRLVELGAGVRHVNLGGLRGLGRKELTSYVFLGQADAAALRALLDSGVEVEARDLPGSRAVRVDATTLAALWP